MKKQMNWLVMVLFAAMLLAVFGCGRPTDQGTAQWSPQKSCSAGQHLACSFDCVCVSDTPPANPCQDGQHQVCSFGCYCAAGAPPVATPAEPISNGGF